jgi:hypothetical protein
MGFMAGYHSAVVRIIRSIFVSLPIELWLRSFARLFPGYTWANYTDETDDRLMIAWEEAQEAIANGDWTTAIGGPKGKADTRALSVLPTNVAVIPVNDWPISDLVKVDSRWEKDKDPSGAFGLLVGATYTLCHACTEVWSRPRVYAALSQIPDVLSYEFQTIILAKLGYVVSGR